MKVLNIVRYTVVGAMLLSAASASAADQLQNQDQDRLRDDSNYPQHVQVQQQMQEQNRLQIEGTELINPEEQKNYSRQHSVLQSNAERKQFQHEHQITNQQRAQSTGVPMPIESPVQLQNKAGKSATGQSVNNGASISEGSSTNSAGTQHGARGQGSGGGRK